jgi:hypothetical protein
MLKNNDDYDDFYGYTFAPVVHANVYPDEIWIECYWSEVFDVCVCVLRKENMLMNMTW